MSCIISKASAFISMGKTRSLHITPKIPLPVQLFSLEDIKVPRKEFFEENRNIFHKLQDDPYDARREQLLYLMDKYPGGISRSYAFEYFTGKESIDAVKPLIDNLKDKHRTEFDLIKPFRKRALSTYILNAKNKDWEIKRGQVVEYSQEDALISKQDEIDFRSFPRKIPELPDEFAKLPTFIATLTGIGNLMKKSFPNLKKLMMHAHHIKLETHRNRIVSNAPEGIHQDGYPFIVSALVVERKNIEGGTSEIFLADKITKICKTTLQEGFGILQPDLGCDLWHNVTPIKPTEITGYRSTIGFDIKILK